MSELKTDRVITKQLIVKDQEGREVALRIFLLDVTSARDNPAV